MWMISFPLDFSVYFNIGIKKGGDPTTFKKTQEECDSWNGIIINYPFCPYIKNSY